MKTISDNYQEYLKQSLSNYDKLKLYEAMNYSLQAGGKRFRSSLIFASAASQNIAEEVMYDIAIAIELIHTYSLIHDDLPCLDDDDLRRGLPTNHLVYGEAMALLAGDNLQSVAFEYVSSAIEKGFNPLVLKYFARCCRLMVEGQSLDIDENTKTSVEDLENIHLLKTGALIEFCMIAPLFYNNKLEVLEQFLEIGSNIGIAFQIQDDILDVEATSSHLGKSNSDISNNKITYTSLIGLEQSKVLLSNKVESAISILKQCDVYTDEFRDLMEFSLNRSK